MRAGLTGTVACAAALALAGFAHAAGAPKTLQFLTPADVDPVRLLPAPPADGSPADVAELAELRQIAAATSADRWAQADWDAKHEDATIFQSAIGPGFDLAALPATAHLLAEVRNEEAIAAASAKDHFKRNRPWVQDSSLRTCSRDDAPQSSYPSGHSTMAFAMAVVLAQAAPDKAPQIMDRARDYATSRMICAAHFRSDIVGGQALGTAVAAEMLQNPRFHEDLVAAERELQAAKLTAATN